MGWIDSGDVKTIFLHGVIPLVVGIGLCFLGCLYLVGILQWSCKRHDDQVAPVTIGSEDDDANEGGTIMTPEAAERAYGPVACEAQLYGLAQKERQAVLEQIFVDCCTHKDSMEALKDTNGEEEDLEQGDIINVDIDTHRSCAICLRDYEDSDEVITGRNCNHQFHKSCVLLWLTNYTKPKDHCPYCRKEMFTATEMKQAALDVLGQERVAELAQFPTTNAGTSTAADNTTTTVSNSQSQDTAEVPTPPSPSPPVVEPGPDVENGIVQER